MEDKKIKKRVREEYARITDQNSSCCGSVESCCRDTTSAEDASRNIGYTEDELRAVPEGSNLGLGCGNPLFSSDTKFDSDSGWPSFCDVISKDSVELEPDYSFGMKHVEVICSRCGGHLGHVFDDGPQPTGKRYCINSSSLNFKEKK